MSYNGFTIKKKCVCLRDSEMEGVPAKILGRATLNTNKILYNVLHWTYKLHNIGLTNKSDRFLLQNHSSMARGKENIWS